MLILFYQIGIFLAIQIAAFFGKNSRNVAVTLIVIFSILQIFTYWLLIFQFVTIFIAFIKSEQWFFNEKLSPTEEKRRQVYRDFGVEYKKGDSTTMKVECEPERIERLEKSRKFVEDAERRSELDRINKL
ncbi:hypothetical protein [Flavobacterium terrigena]|uniref:Uncharacterized protein n=1 Tax=Flavobacterium terrigena TaxID=402734 RepID=A0A1H6VHG1_9FLAO|nr:hypothetical protein [Flavobacterium terrigena]SEJ02414.1 hypothetical protein SAMN05660918_2189 [Flavobacterium terrigena]